jgi:hypothetical protein
MRQTRVMSFFKETDRALLERNKRTLNAIFANLNSILTELRTLTYEAMHNTPHTYLQVRISAHALRFSHIQHNQIRSHHTATIADLDQEGLTAFLKDKDSLPFHILIDTDEVDFKTVSFDTVPLLKRPFLKRSIRNSEFSHEEWVCSLPSVSAYANDVYTYISFVPSPALMQSFQQIKNRNNPIISIQLNAAQQMMAAFSTLSEDELTEVCPWSTFIRKTSSNTWLMTVQQKGALILLRTGTFDSTSNQSDTTQMYEQLSKATRYLSRYGYTANEPISLLHAGFDNPFDATNSVNIPVQNVFHIATRAIKDRMILKRSTVFKTLQKKPLSLWRQLHGEVHPATILINHTGFHPRLLWGQMTAYIAPIFAIRIAAPLCAMLMLCNIVWLGNVLYTMTHLSTLRHEKMLAEYALGDDAHQTEAKLFDAFSTQKADDPVLFLKDIKRILGHGSKILNFKVDIPALAPKDGKATLRNKKRFTGTIKLPKRLVVFRKKAMPATTITFYQQKIEATIMQRYQGTVQWKPLNATAQTAPAGKPQHEATTHKNPDGSLTPALRSIEYIPVSVQDDGQASKGRAAERTLKYVSSKDPAGQRTQRLKSDGYIIEQPTYEITITWP